PPSSPLFPYTTLFRSLETLYQLARFLRRYLPQSPKELPREIQEQIDIESFRVQRTSSGSLSLPRGAGILNPIQEKSPAGKDEERSEEHTSELQSRSDL